LKTGKKKINAVYLDILQLEMTVLQKQIWTKK